MRKLGWSLTRCLLAVVLTVRLRIRSKTSYAVLASFLALLGLSQLGHASSPPQLTGKLVYQVAPTPLPTVAPPATSPNNDFEETLRLYDFATAKPPVNLNATYGWNLRHTINAHPSPDGKLLVFVGISTSVPQSSPNQRAYDDIYLWTIGSSAQPTNLTEGDNTIDEDPIFTKSGDILYKRNDHLALMTVDGVLIKTLDIGSTAERDIERSGPYPSADGSVIGFWEKGKGDADVYVCNADGSGRTPLVTNLDLEDYFPVYWKDNTFLYVRWDTADIGGKNDQIYMVDYKTKATAPVPINAANTNNSDPTVVDSTYLIFSSTRSGQDAQGRYDLYLANTQTQEVWSLSSLGLNGAGDEIGASYFGAGVAPSPVAVSGRVYNAVARNGVSGITVKAVKSGTSTIAAQVATDSQGSYSLSLIAGNYTLSAYLPAAPTTYPIAATFSNPVAVASTPLAGRDFRSVGIGGRVITPGNAGVSGVTLKLYAPKDTSLKNALRTVTSDAQGFFSFDGIVPGNWNIVPTAPTTYTYTPASRVIAVSNTAVFTSFKATAKPK